MLTQVLFLSLLYVFGVLISLPFKKYLPFPFICLTGFLWGMLVWVVMALFILSFAIPYSFLSMSLFIILSSISLVIIYFKQGVWQLNHDELVWLVGAMVAFTLTISIMAQFNFSNASVDSIIQIFLGRAIAYEGFTEETAELLASWGIFLPLLQSASTFLGQDYLYIASPALAFTFLLTFFYLSQRAARQSFFGETVALIFALLGTLTIATTYFIVFHMFYIHNNLLSAAYLFVAVGTFWLALRERNNAWLLFAMLALTGFSLLRTEALLFALIFLGLVLSTGQLSYRVRLYAILPYLIFLLLWYLKLLFVIGEGSMLLDPGRISVVLAVLLCIFIGVGLSCFQWVERILNILPVLMVSILLCVLVFMFIQKPTHMYISLVSIWENMVFYGWWGATWLIILVLFMFALLQPGFPYERLFSFGIPAFFMLLLALAFMRFPFHLGWGDSANRMITHIMPVIFFYFLLKYGHGLYARRADTVDFIRGRQRVMLAIAGGGILMMIVSRFI